MGSRLSTVGQFQGKGLAMRFSYTVGVDFAGENPTELLESIEFLLKGGERKFNLKDGRVFVVEKGHKKEAYILSQKSWELPPYKLAKSLDRMTIDESKTHSQFEKWLMAAEKLEREEKAKMSNADMDKTSKKEK